MGEQTVSQGGDDFSLAVHRLDAWITSVAHAHSCLPVNLAKRRFQPRQERAHGLAPPNHDARSCLGELLVVAGQERGVHGTAAKKSVAALEDALEGQHLAKVRPIAAKHCPVEKPPLFCCRCLWQPQVFRPKEHSPNTQQGGRITPHGLAVEERGLVALRDLDLEATVDCMHRDLGFDAGALTTPGDQLG